MLWRFGKRAQHRPTIQRYPTTPSKSRKPEKCMFVINSGKGAYTAFRSCPKPRQLGKLWKVSASHLEVREQQSAFDYPIRSFVKN